MTDTRVMLTGKWKVSNSLEKQNLYNPPVVISYTGTANDYMEFLRDGTFQCYMNGSLQKKNYSILSNEWLKLDADSFRIVQLMPDRLTLSRNQSATLNEYTVNLTK